MKILKSLDINDLVFINIETTPLADNLIENEVLYDSWKYKVKYDKELANDDNELVNAYNEKANLYPEFGKIVSINIGKIKDHELKIKTFNSQDEKQLLTEFHATMNNIIANSRTTKLCGHFIIGFAIPFIFTRSIVNQVEPCSLIDVSGQKPWDLTAIDTQVLWKGTSIRSASLINIAAALGLKYSENLAEQLILIAQIVRLCRFEPMLAVNDQITDAVTQFNIKPIGILERTFNTKTLNKSDEKDLLKIVEGLTEEEKIIAVELLNIAIQ
jgi:hypothetical protein